MTDSKESLLGLFLRRATLLNSWLCKYYPLTESHISSHKETIDWVSLSSNKYIKWTESFLNQFESRLEWKYALSKNPSLPWSIDFISKYSRKFGSREEISGNIGIPWNYDLLKSFQNQWNWHWLAMNKSIQWTEKMIVDFNLFDKNLSNIIDKNLWTEEFISKYKNKFSWAHLCYNPSLPWAESFIDKYSPFWENEEKSTNKWTVSPWKGVSQNEGIEWSLHLIKKYQKIPLYKPFGLHWTEMSHNEAIPFNDGIFDYFKNKWDWVFLSSNNNLCLSLKHIEQNKNRIIWEFKEMGRHTIALNSSLPWSEELIDKYFDKWYWHEIAMNTGIPWSENLISKYRLKLDNYPLFRNPSLPWSLEFILKFEDQCFDAWNSGCKEISEILWDSIFKPYLDDDQVEEILSGISNPRLLMKGLNETKNVGETLSPLMILSNDVVNIQIESLLIKENFKSLNEVIDKTKVCIVKIANASEKEHINDYMFLQEYLNETMEFKNNLISVLKPIREKIIGCLEFESIDIDYVRDVIETHKRQMVIYSEHKKAGGHISFDFTYLHDCIKKIGNRYLTLSRLLVEIEGFEKSTRDKFDNSKN